MSRRNKGTLTLVGAGPGDPDLLTLKGLKAIQKAHVILYDALINPLLLEHNPKALKIFVGKRRNFVKKTQKEINALIVKYASKGMDVVRLKGGDPMVFGRACEELEIAQEAQISTAVVARNRSTREPNLINPWSKAIYCQCLYGLTRSRR